MYANLLKNCLLDNIYGSVVNGCGNNIGKEARKEQVENGTYWPLRAHTMVGMKRLNNIENCFMDVMKNNIEGDMMETGVWRGGATILMAGLNKFYKQNKRIFVADSFEGLPKPDDRYPEDKGNKLHDIKRLAIGLDTVKDNFKRYDLLDDNIIFVKGFFEHSLKDAPIWKLSILRLDGDMYSSTIQVLDQLYDKVSVGGYIIIDDYALKECKKAVEDFRQKHRITTKMEVVDWTGIYWKKE